MNLELTPAARLANREEVMRSYKPAFQLEAAVCLSILLSFAVYLLSMTL
jgi:hypothetical protein